MRDLAALEPAEIEAIVAAARFDERGLIPAVVTQAGTRELLMVAWLSAESMRMTLASREVTYWSRSRGELWRKGATSGNTQRLVSFAVDCDADVVHLEVEQRGPACHTGTRSCFDGDPLAVRFAEPQPQNSAIDSRPADPSSEDAAEGAR